MFSILIIFVILIFVFLDTKKPKNFPNGPSWFPVIGSALKIAKCRKETGMLIKGIEKIARSSPDTKDVIGFKVGKDKVVFAVSTDSIIEMSTNSDFDGRPYGPLYETRTWNLRRGIALTDGVFWQTQRRFITRHLKQFGYASRGMRENCQNEAEFCLNDLTNLVAKNGGKSVTVTMPNLFNVYLLNTLWLMLGGIRYNPENEQLKVLQDLLCDLFASVDMMGALFSHFPFLRYIAPESSGYNSFVACHNKFHTFISAEVENHKKTFNPTDEPRDLIDAYLKVLFSGDENGKIDESFSELQLLAVCMDMFMAGQETTNKTVNFMFLHVIRNDKIQTRAREEIDRIVGRSRLPTLDDRASLPYCEAIVLESVRFFMANTFGIAHRAMKDTKLCGYDVPKDCMVVAMSSGMLNDIKVIRNPHSFDPENFLDSHGKLSVPDKFLPFGFGKHRCIGESLAKSNLFILFTTIIQNFYLEIPAGHGIPSDFPVDGATANVQDYLAVIIPRK